MLRCSLLLRVFTQARPKADIQVGARQPLALQSPIGWALDIHWRAGTPERLPVSDDASDRGWPPVGRAWSLL